MKTYSLENLTDKYIGKKGTKKRDKFEHELRLELLGQAIKQARQERKLTQEELGEIVGVKKSQISIPNLHYSKLHFILESAFYEWKKLCLKRDLPS